MASKNSSTLTAAEYKAKHFRPTWTFLRRYARMLRQERKP